MTMSSLEKDQAVDLSPLFQPLQVRGVTLPNRFVMPAMQRGWVVKGVPSIEYVDYFRQRAERGVGLIIVECNWIDHPSATWHDIGTRPTPATMKIWEQCVRAVHDAGGKIFLQLGHEGAIRKETTTGPNPEARTLSPSGLYKAGAANGKAFDEEELKAIYDSFIRGATLGREVGFDGVEVHCAHGYLLDQFLWADTNVRSDRYGGSTIGERARFPAEIVEGIRKVMGEDAPIGIRFSQWKECDYKAKIVESPEQLKQFVETMRAAGTDIFHASSRYFWHPEWEGSDMSLAGWTKSFTDAKVITVGSVGLSIDTMDNFFGQEEAKNTGADRLPDLLNRFSRGDFDLVAIGRSLIADPDWINKVCCGDYDKINVYTKQELMGDVEWEPGLIAESHGRKGIFD